MEFLIKAAQLILSLSILVVLHELGHFIPARWFKIRVEKFYLFFDPWFSLFKMKKGDTEYGIGWLPLGGYVKISGMVDESMDKEQMAKPPESWEFRSKPAWQRLIVMVGGVTVNLLLGMVIYIMVLFVWGRDYLPLDQVKYGVHPSEVMKEQGVQEGDRILAINGDAPKTLEDVTKAIIIDDARTLTIERNGVKQDITLSTNVHDEVMDRNEKQLFAPRVPFFIDTVQPGKPAAESTLLKGDRIVAVNGIPAAYFGDFVQAISPNKGKYVFVDTERDGRFASHLVRVSDAGIIGVGNRMPSAYFEIAKERYGLLASIPAGISHGTETLKGYVSSLKLLFSKSGAGQVGGFGAIGSLFSNTWDWQVFWNMTAFLSIILAFMNILPIPALDGGHVVFLLYEMVARRAPNQRVMEVAQMVGMALLFGLILFANGNDVFKWISGKM
ncbi:MAG: RIP metalloprotease RseP [Flavobacteriales bacterium]